MTQLLSNNRYRSDVYQREYSWEETQVGELIVDLAGSFLDEFDSSHERPHVAAYSLAWLTHPAEMDA